MVVGSGAGGGPVAYALARAGASVLVLEKGPRYTPSDFLHDEISSCRRNFFVPYPQHDPHTLRRSPTARAVPTQAGWISQCVGGGTVHMSGFFFRFHPHDFELVSRFGAPEGSTLADWPFAYETLAPWYNRIEREVGISGDVSKNPFESPRSQNFPFPPVQTHPVARWIDAAGARLGLHPYPVPRAIVTRPVPGRHPCVYCSLCGSYGCEVNAKSSTAASILPVAEATGRCEIRPHSMVFEIAMRGSNRAAGVRYIDGNGDTILVESDIVVVAASAIESARLLLLSRSRYFPDGLGNQHGQVGQNLCFSTLTKMSAFLRTAGRSSKHQAELDDRGSPFVGRALQDFLHPNPNALGFPRGGTIHLLWAHPNPIYAAEHLIHDQDRLVWGSELMARMHERFTKGRMLEVEGFSDWLPTPECYVDLDPTVRDRFGLPAARITLHRHPHDQIASEYLAEKTRPLLEALGADPIRTLTVGGETLVLQHGTCRMGHNPRTSVINADGQLHEVPNVYVSDGSALPTSGAVPSTFTIMANALRIGEGIAQRSYRKSSLN